MINALHLLWIIPLCTLSGSIITAFTTSVGKSNREVDIYEEGKRYGYRLAMKEHEVKNYD